MYRLTRRQFLAKSIVSLAVICIPKPSWADPTSSASSERINILWKVFLAISAQWQLLSVPETQEMQPSWDAWVRDRDQNSEQYCNAYKAVVTFTDGGKDDLIKRMIGPDEIVQEDIRKKVTLEFARLLLARGGASGFGYINYRGFYGGPVTSDSFRKYSS